MEHRYEKHNDCRKDNCWVCDGGIAICEVCHLVEGSLTTECPGKPSWQEHNRAVYLGQEDFRDGRWQKGLVSRHSPVFYKRMQS